MLAAKQEITTFRFAFSSHNVDNKMWNRRQKYKEESMIGIISGAVVILGNLLFLIFRYAVAIKKVQEYIFNNNIIYIILASILPFVWWMYSTKEDEWNFYNRKNLTLRLVIINALLVTMQILWTFVFDFLVYKICRIPVQRNMTERMILNLCRVTLVGISGGVGYGIYRMIDTVLTAEETQESINGFRWQYMVDTRKNKRAMYDLTILRDMKTGAEIAIKQVDRLVHQLLLGQSGTGKTSSTIIPAIICDLDKKLENATRRINGIMKMMKEGHAYVEEPKNGEDFNEYRVKAKEGYEKELEKIRKDDPDCGITMIAPNRDVILEAIKLCRARSIKLNVIDPVDQEEYKDETVKRKGLNPFYIPLDLDEESAQKQIINKAQNFSNVLIAATEINAAGDPYFRELNTAVTRNIGIICMLLAYLKGEQTNIKEVHACVRDFEMLRPKVKEIQNILHAEIVVHEIKRKQGNDVTRVDTDENPEADARRAEDIIFTDVEDISEIPEKYINMGMTTLEYTEYIHKIAVDYYGVLYTALTELLGQGAEKMFDQSRGLRNIMDQLLLDPEMRRVLSASEDNFIDWDRALAENEVTFINTALENGAEASTALGLFLILDMKAAVMRRKKSTRTPHFFLIDEASQYMHSVMEDMFALYRQYGVACTIALQSLTQTEKSNTTKYLAGVIMGSGVHILFGRLSLKEMQIYEEIAGTENVETIQETINRSSELDDNYRITQGERTATQERSRISGGKLRYKGFQEVTVFMINQGKVLPGFEAKVAFPKSSDYWDKKVHFPDFSKFSEGKVVQDDRDIVEKTKKEQEEKNNQLEKYRTEIRHTLDSEDIPDLPEINPVVAVDEEARQRRGKRDIYLSLIDGDEPLRKASEHAQMLADNPEPVKEETPVEQEAPETKEEITEEELDEEYQRKLEALDNVERQVVV